MTRSGAQARVTLLIQGRVQGVTFREAARERARRLQIAGVAENLADGSVRIVAEGTRAVLEEFVRWCREGPPLASVSGVQVEWGEVGLLPGEDFSIR
ncbi:MAG: acylphosphatase [Candidatus Terrybacteria bacterium]|nr:acylphosphatase [Candidatus Terrybacteria bacterium]